MYEEPGLKSYIVDIGGELSLHNEIEGVVDRQRLAHLHQVFGCLIVCLMDRGMKHLDTWINEDDEDGAKFAEFFGFKDTGYLKHVRVGETEFMFREMRLVFPKEEDI